LSFAQEGLWYEHRLKPESFAYTDLFGFDIRGPLNVGAWQSAVKTIVERHEILRTAFRDTCGEPHQVVLPVDESAFAMEIRVDVDPAVRDVVRRAVLDQRGLADFGRLDTALFRTLLIQWTPTEFEFIAAGHHLVWDQASFDLFESELCALYTAATGGLPVPLPPVEAQYKEFARHSRSSDASRRAALESWWKDHLKEAPQELDIPGSRQPPPQRLVADREHVRLDAPSWRATRELVARHSVTPFMVTAAAWAIVLSARTEQSEFLIGYPSSTRVSASTRQMIGCFVNLLPLRIRIDAARTILDTVRTVRDEAIDTYAHRDMPFSKLVEVLRSPRSATRSPLFQTMCLFTPAAGAPLSIAGLEIRRMQLPVDRPATYEIALRVGEDGQGGFAGDISFTAGCFPSELIRSMARQFERVLAAIGRAPESRVATLQCASADERREIARVATPVVKERGPTQLQDAIETMLESGVNAPAIHTEQERISYAQLRQRVAGVTRQLHALGVGPESPVGVLIPRSAEAIVSTLAIVRRGAAYVPMDPELPRQRLAEMVRDGDVGVVLTTRAYAGISRSLVARTLVVDSATVPLADASRSARVLADPDNAAYVLYTSGSTGRPKGVVNTYGGLTNRLAWMQEAFDLTSADVVLQKTPLSFDVSVWELLWPFMVGAAVVVARPGGHRDPQYLARLIRRFGVTTVHFVPTMLDAFMSMTEAEHCTSLRRIIASGEALSAQLADRCLRKLRVPLHNLYGPTEAAIDVTHWPCRPAEHSVPIGVPIANTSLYVLSSSQAPVPIGANGEICISGVNLARGYLRLPAETADRFRPDPLVARPGSRLYRTGDRGRLRSDGAFEYVSRLDDQVKIGGCRVEPDELAHVLRAHPLVKDCAVTVREKDGTSRLCAHVVLKPGEQADDEELRNHARGHVPEYMLPGWIVRHQTLPVTSNGKVDKRALRMSDAPLATGGAAYSTGTERRLGAIWADLLAGQTVGRETNFFQAGGSSLTALRLAAQILDGFGVEIPLKTIVSQPTLADLARAIEAAPAAEGPWLGPRERGGPIPLSFSQQSLWVSEQLVGRSDMYNVPAAVRLKGPFDIEVLQRALATLVDRHETLRTRFVASQPLPTQIVEPPQRVSLEVTDAPSSPGDDRDRLAAAYAAEEARQPFDLEHDVPFRARLVRFDPGDHVLLLTLHHIVSDGWSVGVLIRDLTSLYEAYERERPSALPPLAVQYGDYALWQRERLTPERMARDVGYWRQRLAGLRPLVLPLDRSRAPVQSFAAIEWPVSIPPDSVRKLRALALAEQTTLFVAGLSAFMLLMARISGQHDVIVGTPVANRTRRELADLIGFFVNLLPVRADFRGVTTLRDAVRLVRDVLADAMDHQELPFAMLLKQLRISRSRSCHPLFQAGFALQNIAPVPSFMGGVSVSPVPFERGRTNGLDVYLDLRESEDGVRGELMVDRSLIARERAEHLAREYVALVERAATAPDDTGPWEGS
jgi:amino acid adenylation domain-containing protein